MVSETYNAPVWVGRVDARANIPEAASRRCFADFPTIPLLQTAARLRLPALFTTIAQPHGSAKSDQYSLPRSCGGGLSRPLAGKLAPPAFRKLCAPCFDTVILTFLLVSNGRSGLGKNLIFYLRGGIPRLILVSSVRRSKQFASLIFIFWVFFSMVTTINIPTGISLETDLMEILTKTLPVDLRTTVVLVCSQLGITNIQMFNRATSAPNADAFRLKFQTLVAPVLRKRFPTTP